MTRYAMQRLVDPELCSACFSCYEACSKGAIVIERRRVAIDPALCENCGDCVAECATGAIDVQHRVPAEAPHPVAAQLSWDALPPEGMD